MNAKKEKLVLGNDLLRKTLRPKGNERIFLTAGVNDHPLRDQILEAIKGHDTFSSDNDPYGEHDFGAVTVNEEKFFFKIDYYDSNLEFGADPLEDEDFVRVLTIMRAEDY